MDNNETKTRQLIAIKQEWSWGQRFVANVINASGTFLWAAVTLFIVYMFNQNQELVGFRNAYLNLVVPSIAYGILSFVAGLTLVSWLFPYFSYRRIMNSGSDIEKLGCFIFWGSIALSLSIIFLAAS